MGLVMDEARRRPFHERFEIDVGTEEAKRRFVNRANNEVFDYLLSEFRPGSSSDYIYYGAKRAVASSLGIRYQQDKQIGFYVAGSYQRCLQALEAVYGGAGRYRSPGQCFGDNKHHCMSKRG
jgi:hypothetical protein